MANLIVGVNDLATVNPKLAKEWNYEKNDKLPQEYTSGSGKKVWWKCKQGHEWQAIIRDRTRGKGCPYCSGNLPIVGKTDLATTNPELLKEWDYNRNSKLPQCYKSYSRAKVWWKCKQGHEWQTTISNRTAGNGCPYCSGRLPIVGKTDLLSQCPDIAKEWNYEKNYPLTPQNVGKGSGKKVWWKCEKGHEWQTVIATRTAGSGCPYCSGNLPIVGKTDLLSQYPFVAQEWNYEKNDKLPQEYTSGSSQKVWWKCKQGHEWQAIIRDRTRGKGCPYCSGNLPIVGKTDLATTNPELLKEWDYEKNDKLPQEYTSRSHQKVWWKCEKGHSWATPIAVRTRTENCPYCSSRKILVGFNDFETWCLRNKRLDLLHEWNYDKNVGIQPNSVMKGTNKKVWWKCDYGHEWQTSPLARTDINKLNGCPICSGSKGERFISDFLSRKNIAYDCQYTFSDYPIRFYKYDYYLRNYNVLVEFDGKQHFQEVKFFSKSMSFEKRVTIDNIKNEYAFERKKPLLRIPYIYDVIKHSRMIEHFLMNFIKTRQIPKEIIDFYSQFCFSNYGTLATHWNSKK